MTVFVGIHIDEQRLFRKKGKGFGKDLAPVDVSKNRTVAPEIIAFYGDAAGKDQSEAIGRFPCTENPGSLGKQFFGSLKPWAVRP